METSKNHMGNKKHYQLMEEAELHFLADKMEVPFRSAMTKEQLIHALETYEKVNTFFSQRERY